MSTKHDNWHPMRYCPLCGRKFAHRDFYRHLTACARRAHERRVAEARAAAAPVDPVIAYIREHGWPRDARGWCLTGMELDAIRRGTMPVPEPVPAVYHDTTSPIDTERRISLRFGRGAGRVPMPRGVV